MKKITLAALAMAASTFASNVLAGDGIVVPPSPLPEPGSFALLAAGLAGVVAVRLMKRK